MHKGPVRALSNLWQPPQLQSLSLIPIATLCAAFCCCALCWLSTGILQHPWFKVGLPPDALAMNHNFLQLPRSCCQSEQDIWRIVRKAQDTTHTLNGAAVNLSRSLSQSPNKAAAVAQDCA